MEVRMHPRTEGSQRCLTFQLSVSPKTRVTSYRDYLGNTIHHFDVPGHHKELTIVAEALVDSLDHDQLGSLGPEAWDELDTLAAQGDYWEMLAPSHFAQPTDLLRDLSSELGVTRRGNPLGLLLELNSAIYESFEYVPKSTRVDSPIDDDVIRGAMISLGTSRIFCWLLPGKSTFPAVMSAVICITGIARTGPAMTPRTRGWKR